MKKRTQKIVVWLLFILMLFGTLASFAVYFIS